MVPRFRRSLLIVVAKLVYRGVVDDVSRASCSSWVSSSWVGEGSRGRLVSGIVVAFFRVLVMPCGDRVRFMSEGMRNPKLAMSLSFQPAASAAWYASECAVLMATSWSW